MGGPYDVRAPKFVVCGLEHAFKLIPDCNVRLDKDSASSVRTTFRVLVNQFLSFWPERQVRKSDIAVLFK